MHLHLKYSLILLLLGYLVACNSQTTRPDADEEDINALVANSLVYAQRGALPLARNMIEKALVNHPRHVAANNIAGLIYGQMGEQDLAIDHFNIALDSDPNDASTLVNFANFLCTTGDKASAIDLFIRSANNKNNANREIAYTNAGLCAMRIPDRANAAEYFIRALSIQADNHIALYQLAKINFIYGLGEQAHDYLNQYAQTNSHTPETLKLGIQISRLNDNLESENSYLSILQRQYPDSSEYQWALSNK